MEKSIYRMIRNHGCRIYDEVLFKGYRGIILENEKIQIWLLLDKGGEPVRWLHKPTDTDLVWFTQRNLLPSHPLFSDYQMTYFGGWQEMFPEVSQTHTYRGATLHRGESAILPWDYRIVKDERDEVCVTLFARMQSMPFRIEKTIRLLSDSALVRVDETIYNESPKTALEANWGHHLAFGSPFIQENSVVEMHPSSAVHHPLTNEQWNWPIAHQDGLQIDLSRMPPAGTKRDLLYVMSPDGRYAIQSPNNKVIAEIRWNNQIWPYVWYWQNFQHDYDHPFFGCDYNIGLEMFNVPPKLTVAEAVQNGLALQVPPLGQLSSWIELGIRQEEELYEGR